MRGLNIRIEYANAKIGLIRHPESRTAIGDVLCDAEDQGIADFHDGECIVPAMFADVPELVRAWEIGYDGAMAETREREAWRLAEQA